MKLARFDDLLGQPFERFRCWGLVREVYGRSGIWLPHDVLQHGLEPAGGPIEEGDVVALAADQPGVASHCALVVDGGRVLHSVEGRGVVVDRYDAMERSRKILGRYRLAVTP